ncbi:MAG: hypothetical protein H0T47_10870 [Planctomycetaceae bacterium]|nr:hypothetical protein [Planctomycetaceae bacterium]
MNRYMPGVYVIPEDDRDRQLAAGFILHDGVDGRRIKVMPPAGGWRNVLQTFLEEYVQILRKCPDAHVVLLIDFDDQVASRRNEIDRQIPKDIKSRVYVVGPKHTPEKLKAALSENHEKIGTQLADECDTGNTNLWNHEQLVHNNLECDRLADAVKPFLFQSGL